MTTTTGGYEARSAPEIIAVSDTIRPDGARSRIAWSAIFAGVVLVFAIELLLNALGAGIGLGFVDPSAGTTPSAQSLSTGAGIWFLVSTLIAFIASGYVAGRLAGAPSHYDGLLHGLVVWGTTLLLSLYMLGSVAGGVLGGAARMVGGAASLAGPGVSAAAPHLAQAAGISSSDMQDRLDAYMAPVVSDPAAMNSAEAQKAIAVETPALAQGGEPAAQARQRIISIIAAQQHITQDEAARRFDDARARFEQDRAQAMRQARQVADASAAAASQAAYITFGALLLGAIAAAAGGLIASPRRSTLVSRRVT